MSRRRFVSAVVLFALLALPAARAAAADELTVLCSNGLKAVLEDLGPKFESATHNKLVVTYGLAASLGQRIRSGEAFDVAFLTPAVVDDLIAAGKISRETRTEVARSGLALAIRKGMRKPDISTSEAFKRTLLNAKSIAYAKEGASGVLFAATIQRLGIAGDLQSKSRLTATGEAVSDAVLKGEVELGVLPLSEILPVAGEEPVVFPADVQSYIVMVGGASAGSKHAAAAGDLIKYVTAPGALPVLKAKGMER
jgi:molybdate transport system substrate-binding protein